MRASDALFVRDGMAWRPTGHACGPWSPDALHGGPVAALLARAAEAAPTPDDRPMHPARLTVELLRPVGFAPLLAEATVDRPGRKVQIVHATLRAGDAVVARATLLRLRIDADGPAAAAPGATPPAAPSTLEPYPATSRFPVAGTEAFHATGVEHRFAAGDFAAPGPATDWIRLRVAVVEGETPSPLQRVAAAADFGNGISGVLDPMAATFVNPDLTIVLHRVPRGEWVAVEAATAVGTGGVGLATSRLWDADGEIGRAAQTLLVERVR